MLFDIQLKGDIVNGIIYHYPVLSPLPIKPHLMKLASKLNSSSMRKNTNGKTLNCNNIVNHATSIFNSFHINDAIDGSPLTRDDIK